MKVRFLSGVRDYLCCETSKHTLGSIQPPIQWVSGTPPLLVMCIGTEHDHSYPSNCWGWECMDPVTAVPHIHSWVAYRQIYLTVHYFTSKREPMVSTLTPLQRLSKWPDWTNYCVAGSPIIGFVRSWGSDTTRRKEKKEKQRKETKMWGGIEQKNLEEGCANGNPIEQT